MAEWLGEMSARATVLASSPTLPLVVGRFRCTPDDPAWHEVNTVGPAPHVVFPRRAVAITPAGSSTIAADANRAMLYGAWQEYRHAPLDPAGDECVFVALGAEVLADMPGMPLVDAGNLRFSAPSVSIQAGAFAALHLLLAQVRAGHDDPLLRDELLLELLTRILDPTAVEADGHAMAEDVRGVLASRYHEPLALAEIAAAVGVSPYHLHRTFRATTGWTIHRYRDQLRLRAGFARILDGEEDLATLAYELGYASHSHFTARFRRLFGRTPSDVRRDAGGDVRKMVTAGH